MKRLAVVLGLLSATPCLAQTTVTLTPTSPNPWVVPSDFNPANNTEKICAASGACVTLTNQALSGSVPFSFTADSATFAGKTALGMAGGSIVISYTPAVVPPPPPVSSVTVTPFTPPPCVAAGDKIVGPYDAIPNFALHPTVMSAGSGAWSVPATWTSGKVPAAGDVVKVACGHVVTVDGLNPAVIAALGVDGTLTFARGSNTSLKVGTLLVNRSGWLDQGTPESPITANSELIVADRPLATLAADPQTGVIDSAQFGTGIIVFGQWTIAGKAHDTWAALAQEPKAGDKVLNLAAAPQGWTPGDMLVLPDTRQLSLNPTGRTPPSPSQIETPTIAAYSGATVTLTAPLAFSHLGSQVPHDPTGKALPRFLPHVGNLSSNVTVRSENPNGTRGHTLATEYARVDIRYAAFLDLGRTTSDPLNPTTNHIGRYALHCHHCAGPTNPTNTGYQFAMVGVSVAHSKKWNVSIHDSHFGYVGGSFFYDADGANFVTESANETQVVVEKNLAIRAGVMHDGDLDLFLGGVEADDKNPLRQEKEFGSEGSAFWLTSPDVICRGNVAADAAFAGFQHNSRPETGGQPLNAVMPKFRGARFPNTGPDWQVVSSPPIREDSGNTAYGVAVGSWNIWGFVNHFGVTKNFTAWNFHQRGVYDARNIGHNFDGLTLLADQAISNSSSGTGDNWLNHNFCFDQVGGDSQYSSGALRVKNFDIEGCTLGIRGHGFLASGALRSMSYFDTGYLANYINDTVFSPVDANDRIFHSVKFVQNPGPPVILSPSDEGTYGGLGAVSAAVSSSIGRPGTGDGLTLRSRWLSFDHNGGGQNLQFYLPQQAPGFVMVERDDENGKPLPFGNCVDAAGTLHAGLTNAQCKAQYGVATMGEVASCADTTTHPEFPHGFVCPAALTFDDALSGK